WITEKQIEITNFFAQKREAFLVQNVMLTGIDNIDKSHFPYEFSGRLQDIVDSQTNILTETSDFIQKISKAFTDLKNFSSLNEEEVDKLNFVQNYFNQLIMAFNNQYSNLSRQIEERQNISS